MLKVVLDTNVFISAVLFKGISNQLVNHWQNKNFKFLLSKEILNEYIKVLHYPKFKLNKLEIKEIIKNELLPYITPLKVKTKLNIIKEDFFDNKFICCAVEGKANFIISGDKHLLQIKKYKSISIVKIEEFLKIVK